MSTDEAPSTRGWATRHLPTVVALAALFVSVATTAIDLRHSRSQERHAAALELTDLVQRIVALPRQHAADPATRAGNGDAALEDGFTKEKTALAARAAEILRQYPGVGSPAEYQVIAEAVVTNIEGVVVHVEAVPSAIALLEQGVARTESALDKAGLLVRGGSILFRHKKPTEARKMFRRAVDGVDDSGSLAFAASYYEAYWGQWEADNGECDEAERHLGEARRHLELTGNRTGRSAAIDDLEKRLASCRTPAEPAGDAPAVGVSEGP